VNLSIEVNKNLKVVGQLKIPTGKFSADYQSAIKKAKQYTLTLEVLFPGHTQGPAARASSDAAIER
jgi:hypothetical protein